MVHICGTLLRYILGKMSANKCLKPVIAVLGATGTGKSKLALEIATKFNGEIISADSMQVYRGLDVITNKVTPEERELVPHHMLDFFDPLEVYNVVDFRNAALPLIDELHENGKLAVIVGGTHYYVEALLWDVLISPGKNGCKSEISEDNGSQSAGECEVQSENSDKAHIPFQSNISKSDNFHVNKIKSASMHVCLSENINRSGECSSVEKSVCVSDIISDEMENWNSRQNMDKLSNEDLLKTLEKVDPEMASRYHPNDRRKIVRSLEVWAQTGVRHSDHLRKQTVEVGVADLGGKVRFPNAALLWITCRQDVLDKRLDARVDAMIESGLLQELTQFHARFNAPRLRKLDSEEGKEGTASLAAPSEDPYTRGIWQSIGFKEFHQYLLLEEKQRDTELGKKLYQEGIEKMKLRTRQYSRRQLKWIRNRFSLRDRQRIPVYEVDGTDPALWSEVVSPVMEEVVSALLEGRTPQTSPVVIQTDRTGNAGDKTRHYCEVCSRIFIGTLQWESHLQSRKHRKVLKRKNSSNVTETVDESGAEIFK